MVFAEPWVVLLIGWRFASTNQKQVWVATPHQFAISNPVSQTSYRDGDQWWRREMSAVLSGYSYISFEFVIEIGIGIGIGISTPVRFSDVIS